MNDDWRLQVDLHEENHARAERVHLDAQQLQPDLSEAFHDRVIVSRDGAEVFLYTGTREQAEEARKAIEADAPARMDPRGRLPPLAPGCGGTGGS